LAFKAVAGQEEAGPWGVVVPFKLQNRLDSTAFPQYKVEWLYCHDSVILLSQLGMR